MIAPANGKDSSALGRVRYVALVARAPVLAGFASAPEPDRPVMANPVVHFEIPVMDMDRAVRFYRAVLGHDLRRQRVDGYDMAFFPRADGSPGASGALAKGDVYVPTKTGVIIYFDVPDIDAALALATRNGGSVLYPKTSVGEAGHVAEIGDSEGNRIGLSAVD